MKKKLDFEKYFKGKKITLMGLGGLGRGLVESEFLIKYGADLIITDLLPESKLKKEVSILKKALKKYKKSGARLKFTLGKQKMSDFKNRDIVLYANGVALNNKYIEVAKKESKIVTKSIALVFWIIQKESKNIKTIGVTGTKGKSTTTALMEHLLKTNGEIVFTGGNLRGASNLPILEKISFGNFLLAELDSWLLQGLGNLKISPNFSIFTNFFNDHQNYYHSMKKYFNDKSYIFKFQKRGDFSIFTNQSADAYKKYFNKRIPGKKIIARTYKIPKWNYTIFGEHNKKNIAQVLVLAELLKIPKKIQKKAMESFITMEGRFEYLAFKKDIHFYNDNNSTTPFSTVLSLRALIKKYPKSKIYLLAGGADKEFNFRDLAKNIEKYAENTALFSGSGTEKIISHFSKNFKKYQVVNSMKEAFEKSMKNAKKGDIVILSPGAASFGVFKNEYDRNDQFLEQFKKLK